MNERAASVGGLKSALKTRGDTIQSGAPFTACWDSARRSAGTRRAVTTSAAALKPRHASTCLVARGVCSAGSCPPRRTMVRWTSESWERDRRDGRQHPGFHLQIIILALPRHFFLMRFEITHALSDFVAR